MKRLVEWFAGLLPRRRLRSWRYVSPRRHGAGVTVLLAIVIAICGYWYLTNDRLIRQEAIAYLKSTTDGDWRIRHAHFSFFGGIQLTGVELHAAGLDAPFFRADKVYLRHDPWALLVRQKLDVRQGECDVAVIRLTYDAGAGGIVYPKLRFSMGSPEANGQGSGAEWPPIVVRHATIIRTDKNGPLDVQWGEANTEIAGCSAGNGDYQLAFGGGEAAGLSASITLNMSTGQVGAYGKASLESPVFQQFGDLRRLGIRGQVAVVGRWDPKSGLGFLEANFIDASMSLPPDFGGMEMRAIRGHLRMDANGIVVRGLWGQIAQAHDATVSISGQCDRLEPNSPFDFHVSIRGFELPSELPGTCAGAALVKYVRDHYVLEGRLNADANVARGPDGHVTIDGRGDGAGLTTMDKSFPYALREAKVDVRFTDKRLTFRRLSGVHGTGRIEVEGNVFYPPEGKTYDLHVNASDVTVDDELKAALSQEQRQMCDAFDPSGKVGARIRVHVDSPGEPEKQDITLIMNRKASVEYTGFPYRLTDVFGEVQLGARDIAINSMCCDSPPVNCRVDGTIHLDERFRGEANLVVHASMPLDGRLERALGESGKAIFDALRPAGMAQNVLARVYRPAGGRPVYNVTAALEGGSFTFDRFPYTVTDANGLLVIEPNMVRIEDLSARHKDTPIRMSGTVAYGVGGTLADLQVNADNLRADQELFAAMPPCVQRVWKQLSPEGQADVEFQLHWLLGDDPNELDYRCRITARDMQFKYAGFPYALKGLSGRAFVTPKGVELRDVTGSEGPMNLTLDGNVTSSPDHDIVDLRLRADGLPVDAELLAALPPQSAAVFSRLKQGGTCSIDLSRLLLIGSRVPDANAPAPAGISPASVSSDGPTTRSASSPATAPLAPLEGPFTEWLMEGGMFLKEADVDLGVPAKLTGGLRGRISSSAQGLSLDANILLSNLSISQRVMTDVIARMRKDPGSAVIRFDDIVGKAYGGRMEGFARVRLGEAPEYGLHLTAERMNLNDIFNASAEPNQRTAVDGLLDATIDLTATGGPRPSRNIKGVLHLAKARTQQVPVLVDQLQPVFLSLPGEPFSDGVIEYILKGDKVLFHEIHLTGPGISIVGSGTMNLKNEALKLAFVSRQGSDSSVPGIDNLADDLVGGLLRELMEVRVTGTLKNPKVSTVPLRSVDALVKKILNPEAE